MAAAGHASINPQVTTLFGPRAGSLLLGFVATFFLAWSEEAIFRGTLYPFLCRSFNPWAGMIATSFIFSLAHNLHNPLGLLTTEWRLGLGLFLLGLLLNTVFALSNKLYVSMGIHAGLVFVKVILRRIPLITLAPTLPWYLHADLRQSTITHLLFIFTIAGIIFIYRERLHFVHKNWDDGL
jgi:membrane protease YdiL (CAAX protease family)